MLVLFERHRCGFGEMVVCYELCAAWWHAEAKRCRHCTLRTGESTQTSVRMATAAPWALWGSRRFRLWGGLHGTRGEARVHEGQPCKVFFCARGPGIERPRENAPHLRRRVDCRRNFFSYSCIRSLIECNATMYRPGTSGTVQSLSTACTAGMIGLGHSGRKTAIG